MTGLVMEEEELGNYFVVDLDVQNFILIKSKSSISPDQDVLHEWWRFAM
jgi:hypothetical protein